MQLSVILAIQIVVVFILTLVGFVQKKRSKLDTHTVKQLTDLLLGVVTPCVLINAYQKEFKPDQVSPPDAPFAR